MARLGRAFTAMLVMALFVLPALSSGVAAQGSPLPAVELNCGSDPVMNVLVFLPVRKRKSMMVGQKQVVNL